MDRNSKIIGIVAGAGVLAFVIWKLSKKDSGKSFSKNCSNFQSQTNIKNCVADGISNYLSSTINSPGDCATIQVKVGLTSTNVSGKNC
jgi:hypothetical protein